MGQERKGQGSRAAHAFQRSAHGKVDGLEVLGTNVGHLSAFDVSPNGFHGVQFRRVAGKSLHPEPVTLMTQIFRHDPTLGRRQAIPNQVWLSGPLQVAFSNRGRRRSGFPSCSCRSESENRTGTAGPRAVGKRRFHPGRISRLFGAERFFYRWPFSPKPSTGFLRDCVPALVELAAGESNPSPRGFSTHNRDDSERPSVVR